MKSGARMSRTLEKKGDDCCFSMRFQFIFIKGLTLQSSRQWSLERKVNVSLSLFVSLLLLKRRQEVARNFYSTGNIIYATQKVLMTTNSGINNRNPLVFTETMETEVSQTINFTFQPVEYSIWK